MKSDDIKNWLSSNAFEIVPFASIVAIYGSVSRNESNPRDCDFLVVSKSHHESADWYVLVDRIAAIEDRFTHMFKMDLNTMLLTENEWQENRKLFADHT